jgi:hypothetical protein
LGAAGCSAGTARPRCAIPPAQKEASEVFFSVTKLYQSKDANLRRMVYLVIKDVCPGSDEVIIITSSLMKDMNSKTDLYRSNAIRVLCSIIDSQLLGQIERYLKQARFGCCAPAPPALPRPAQGRGRASRSSGGAWAARCRLDERAKAAATGAPRGPLPALCAGRACRTGRRAARVPQSGRAAAAPPVRAVRRLMRRLRLPG